MPIQELRTEKERTLYTISLVYSCICWALLILGTLGIGLIWIASAVGFALMAQAMFLAALKGNGVRISKAQFPDLYERLEKAAKKLELPQVPEAYIVNHRGVFNAFATRFLDRNFVVLYAELLEACAEDDGSIDFIIGHEVGHLALGHLKMAPVLLPSRIVPLLGAAYSRACEYSCDRAGTIVAGRSEGAVRGLAVLAAGGRYAPRLDVDAYLEQRLETGNFWMGVVELAMSHPYLPKRVGAILADTRPEIAVPVVPRNGFAYVVAPMFAGGGLGGVMAIVLVSGVLAAIAVPAFAKYQARSIEAALESKDADPDDLAKALEEKMLRAEQEEDATIEDEPKAPPPVAAPPVQRERTRAAAPAARNSERSSGVTVRSNNDVAKKKNAPRRY